MTAEGGRLHRLELDPQAAEARVLPVPLDVREEMEEDVDRDDVADVFRVVRGQGLEGHPHELGDTTRRRGGAGKRGE